MQKLLVFAIAALAQVWNTPWVDTSYAQKLPPSASVVVSANPKEMMKSLRVLAKNAGNNDLDDARKEIDAKLAPLSISLSDLESCTQATLWVGNLDKKDVDKDDSRAGIALSCPKAATLFAALKGVPKATVKTLAGWNVVTLPDDGDTVSVAIKGQLLVSGDSPTSMQETIDFLDGKAGGVAVSSVIGKPPAGTFLSLGLSKTALAKVRAEAESFAGKLDKVTSGRLHLGNATNGLFGEMQIDTVGPQYAAEVKSVIQGLLSLATLAGDEKSKPFIDAIKLTTRESQVNVRLDLSSVLLNTLLQELK